MKVSVIIPTRNRTRCLSKLIKNLENQTVIPEEVLIVVHNKDMRTKEFLNKLSSNLKLEYYETDGGSCKGRNVGIENASGDLVVFIEDDVILEKDYIKNIICIFSKKKVDVIAGYTFDIVDLTTPWFVRRKEVEYIFKNKNEEFFSMIIAEISKKFPNYSDNINNKYKICLYSLIRGLRNFFKIIILQEWPKKGIILPSGYRSEMPTINNLNGLKKVQWFGSGNFSVRKMVINKFRFNEDIEILPYALAEDLELSARIGKDYEIFISPDVKLFHLRSVTGVKIDQRQRFQSMIVNFYRISLLRGNKYAYWWSVIGLTFSRIFSIPFSCNTAISELKGIFDGIKYLGKLDE